MVYTLSSNPGTRAGMTLLKSPKFPARRHFLWVGQELLEPDG